MKEKKYEIKDEHEIVTVRTKEHEYKVPILNAVEGVAFAVRHPALFAGNLDREALESLVMEKIADPEILVAFTFNLMSGMKIDDEVCDDMGFCSLFRRRPLEIYRALIVSLCANFGDCFPFLEDLSGTEVNL